MSRLKKALILISVCFVLALSYRLYDEYKINQELANSYDMADTWVNYVLAKDYEDANKIRQSGDYKINVDKFDKANSGVLYKQLLDKVVSNTKVVSVNNLSNHQYEYTLEVPKYTINKDVADKLKPQLKDLTAQYTGKYITKEDFEKKLEALLNSLLNESFSSGSTSTVKVTLEIRKADNQLTLYHTNTFISSLFDESKVVDILNWYKTQIDFNLTN